MRKSVDVSTIKKKYGLQDDEDPTLRPQYVELLEYSIDQDFFIGEPVTVSEQPSFPICKVKRPSVKPSTKSAGSKVDQQITSSPVTAQPAQTILNHFLGPKIARNTRIEHFKCDLCSNSCSTKLAMERHMQQVHRKGSSCMFTCETCLKTFAKKTTLQTHQKIHLVQRPAYDCTLCGKMLSSQTAVANHIKWIHTDRKEFKCESCLKMFATVSCFEWFIPYPYHPISSSNFFYYLQKGSLKEHCKIHSDIKQHICPICKKRYKTASTLTQHFDTHAGTEYHCSECGLRLNSKRTLRQHYLKHSDVNKHTCEICKAQFKRTKAYKEHLIAVHTDIRAYACDWCDKTFTNGANCRKHKKDSHLEELKEAEKTETKKIVRLPKIDELLSISMRKWTAKIFIFGFCDTFPLNTKARSIRLHIKAA